MARLVRGIITHINHDKAHGYIRYGANKSLYFHQSHVTDLYGFGRLKQGLWVAFEIIKHGKNPMAVDVKRVVRN